MENVNYINDDGFEIPQDTIVVVSDDYENFGYYKEIVEPLAGQPKRDWFNSHFYYCLPLTIGNQYGFAIKSMWDFKATWNGDSSNAQDIVFEFPDEYDHTKQAITCGFSEGVMTIQNKFHFRTPRGINLMTIQPPNFGIPGTFAMTGVVESDNLRRDFTFNLKLTDPGRTIEVRKGDWLGAFIPIQRYFVDKFSIVNAVDIFDKELITNEMNDNIELARQRQGPDKDRPHDSGRKYFNGEHAFGCPYPDHQKRIVVNKAKEITLETETQPAVPSDKLSRPPRLLRH